MAPGRRRNNIVFNAKFLCILNTVGLVLSIPVLIVGVLLANRNSADCTDFLAGPLMALGIILLLASALGLVAGCCAGFLCMFWVHLLVILVLVVLLLCFAIFALEVSTSSFGHTVPGIRFKEYQLLDYPRWMRHRVQNKAYWAAVVDCLLRSRICSSRSLPYTGPRHWNFTKSKPTPAQSGCCKPPTACNFTYVSATTWIDPRTPNADPDCLTWSNDENLLCYYCDSCKAGVIETSRRHWRIAGFIDFGVLIVLILLYCSFTFHGFRKD